MFSMRINAVIALGLAVVLAGCGRDTEMSENIMAAQVAAQRAEAAQKAAETAAAQAIGHGGPAAQPPEAVAFEDDTPVDSTDETNNDQPDDPDPDNGSQGNTNQPS